MKSEGSNIWNITIKSGDQFPQSHKRIYYVCLYIFIYMMIRT